MTKALIEVNNVGLNLSARRVLDRVSLSVSAKEIVTLIGPNGAGKTVLVKTVLGLLHPDEGSIVTQAGLSIGYMPQKIHLSHTIPMTVERFLQLGLANREYSQVTAVLEEVDVLHLAKSPLQSVSGGELQRILLARCLLRDPQLLVLDEPVQGVDIHGQQELYDLIANIRDQRGCGILMVSHDLHFVMAATDRVICLNHHVCCTGAPEAVRLHPEYLQLFGKAAAGFAVYEHQHDHHHDMHGDVIPGEHSCDG